MKKFILALFLFAVAFNTQAQLNNTKWKGTIQTDETINVVFHFANDTLEVINTDEATVIETLAYTAKDNLFTLKKIAGESECDAVVAGRYKYEIKNGEITFTLVEDDCQQRSAILNNSKWIEVK